MKTKPVFKIEIASPCTESWNEMTPVEGGRFCDNCTKKVIDFSTWTDTEIIQYTRNNHQPTCGRFLDSQLNRNLLYLERERANSFIPVLLVSTALAAGVASNASAGTKMESSKALSEQVDTIPSFIAATDTTEDYVPGDVPLNVKLIPGDNLELAQFNRLTCDILPGGWFVRVRPILAELFEREQQRDSAAIADYNTKNGRERMPLPDIMVVDPNPQRRAKDMVAMRMGAFGIAMVDPEKYPADHTYDIIGIGAFKRKEEPSLFDIVKYDGKVWPPKDDMNEPFKVEVKPLNIPDFNPYSRTSDKDVH